MDFSEQFHIKGKVWDGSCDEESISSKTYQRWYVYREFGQMMSVMSL